MMMHQQTINILNTSVSGNRQDYLSLAVSLYEASITGDWETAKLIFDKHPDFVRLSLSKNLGTALHVAATSNESELTLNYVKNLVNVMTSEELEVKNNHSNTAFWLASATGKLKMAMIMMEKNSRLLDIRGKDEYLPLSIAAKTGSYNIVKWLYNNSHKMTANYWTDRDMSLTLLHCVERDFFDVAVQILEDRPELARNVSILEVLARKPDALDRVSYFSTEIIRVPVYPPAEIDSDALKVLRIIWGHATRTMTFDEIEGMLRGPPTSLPNGSIQYYSRTLFVAAERSNTKFIVELLRTYPDLMFDKNDDGLTIFHIAVMHRHHDIYNLLYEIGDSRNDICILNDMSGNNMLHLVGKTSKEMAAKTSGASLLLQGELMWFEEVYEMMPAYLREAKNEDGLTPYELFSKENQDLVSKGLELMKDCMIVATLIVTVAFAVAFTIPGGYNQETGLPVFIHQRAFLVFVIADAVSLFSSATSLTVFLSVLTSSANQRALMHSLPRKLMICLLLLVISVAAMMVTFSASFFVLYHDKLTWIPLFIAAFATSPIILFVIMQYPFIKDMQSALEDTRSVFELKQRLIYTTKPRLL